LMVPWSSRRARPPGVWRRWGRGFVVIDVEEDSGCCARGCSVMDGDCVDDEDVILGVSELCSIFRGFCMCFPVCRCCLGAGCWWWLLWCEELT
jgi:hypothetical protein